jgi:hypothetical protein
LPFSSPSKIKVDWSLGKPESGRKCTETAQPPL